MLKVGTMVIIVNHDDPSYIGTIQKVHKMLKNNQVGILTDEYYYFKMNVEDVMEYDPTPTKYDLFKNKQLEELEKIDNKLITLRKELTSLSNQSIILRGLFKNE